MSRRPIGALDSQIPLFEGVLVYDANLAKIIDSKALYDISFTRIDIIGDRWPLSRSIALSGVG